ncbi:MAG TPA: metalloregulator ArsR/SmtB family transcription factor [Acidimicrobiales bacterium]|nr:MAG: hypothetical protein B7Z69_04090 [Actinobacteria bacterium 21-73-9]HQU26030.1 metalloregulator ArsR/SmtB family transcription factor [Acidimicrobiales bacterium]
MTVDGSHGRRRVGAPRHGGAVVAPKGEGCEASVVDVPLDEAEALRLARLLGALADPVRLRLLSILDERGAACSCDLEVPLGRSQPTISHHTKVLAESGVVVAERRGRWTWWSISPESAGIVRSALGA